MAWVRLDDKRATNGKLRMAGFAARGLDEAAICWSAHEEDDGRISAEDVQMLAVMHGCRQWRRIVRRLVDVGKWDEVNGGYQINDFPPVRGDREPIPAWLRQEVIDRAGHVCQLCGGEVEPADVHIDHILPCSLGGRSVKHNLQVSHSRCNMSKGNRV